jgi:CheY-like chemotaxis protein
MEKDTYSVFLVDDDKFLLDMYSLKFTKSGLLVSTAASSTDALRKLREGFAPDIIILDIVMPVMDGLELLEHIRKEKLSPKSVIIMLTNQGQTADIERAKKLGVDGYIVKASTIPSEVLTEVLDIAKKRKAGK